MRKTVLFLLVLILFTGGTVTAFAEQIPYDLAVLTGSAATGERENSFIARYNVSPGDSLASIARKFGLDWQLLAVMNNLSDPDKIYPAQQLFLPVMQEDYVVVKPGGTLWDIAKKFAVRVADLAFENGIKNPELLQVGQKLRIPGIPVIPTFLQDGDEAVQTLSRGEGGFVFSWPLVGTVTSLYGPRGSEFHHGIDVSTEGSDVVRAAAGGKVMFSGWMNSVYGNTVIIRHGREYRTLYAHNSENLVKEGQAVRAGQAIGRAGASGRATGPHLHFEIYRNDNPVDPLQLLAGE